MKIFKDRKSAGILLANRLKKIKADLVLGIPRGGVVVAKEVATSLNLPLDVVITRKIGAPNQPELALGAVDQDGKVVGASNLKIDDEIAEIKRRENLYRHTRPGLAKLIEGKTVILVDDGIATGATVLSAIKYLKRHGAKVILAVPVASKEALEKVTSELASHPERSEGSSIVILHIPDYFQAVGQFYQEFESVSDSEVVQYLNHEQ